MISSISFESDPVLEDEIKKSLTNKEYDVKKNKNITKIKIKINKDGLFKSIYLKDGNIKVEVYETHKIKGGFFNFNQSRKLKKALKKTDLMNIYAIHIVKEKINSIIKSGLNFLSNGDFERKQIELDYDDVYHMFLIIVLKKGDVYRLEKNESVVLTKFNLHEFGHLKNYRTVYPKRDLDINTMINNTELYLGKYHTYRYGASYYNCQNFVNAMIISNQLAVDDSILNFIKPQDSKQLINTIPFGETITNGITDLGHVLL